MLNVIDAFILHNTGTTKKEQFGLIKVLNVADLIVAYDNWVTNTFHKHLYPRNEELRELHQKMGVKYEPFGAHPSRSQPMPEEQYEFEGTWARCARGARGGEPPAIIPSPDPTYNIIGYKGVAIHDDTAFRSLLWRCIIPTYGQNWQDCASVSPEKGEKMYDDWMRYVIPLNDKTIPSIDNLTKKQKDV
jgi:hypothetical protein